MDKNEMSTADFSVTNTNLLLTASENKARAVAAISVLITPLFHLAATVCFVGLRILKFLSFWHFWKTQQEPYSFEARLSDAAMNLLKTAAHPFAILAFEFLSFYGLFRPYEAQKLYCRVEEFMYDQPLLTSFWEITPTLNEEKNEMKNNEDSSLKGGDCLNQNLEEVSTPFQNTELKDPGLKAGVSPNLIVSETEKSEEKKVDLLSSIEQENEELLDIGLVSETNLSKEASIVDHAARILRDYQQALLKKGKTEEEIANIEKLFDEYKKLSEKYSGEVKKIFQEATFLVVHGSMHVSHVALMVPVMVSFYKSIEDKRAMTITEEEIKALQIAALYHDYGRAKYKNDLIKDTEIMEEIGAEQCRVYLESCGFDKNIAEKMKQTIAYKDKTEIGGDYTVGGPLGGSFDNKCIFREILQNCDGIGYLRAHDASFDPNYLDVTRRLRRPGIKVKASNDAFERLHKILDANKLFLMSIGDSPNDEYRPLSKKYYLDRTVKFSGRVSFEDKRFYETNPNCFEILKQKMSEFEELR